MALKAASITRSVARGFKTGLKGLAGLGLAALGTGAIGIGGYLYWQSRDLPALDAITGYRPATVTQIYAPNGQLIDEFAAERRIFTPADQIPDLIKTAILSAEDKNFYRHPGYDLRAIGAAALEAWRSGGERMRGASTITQQVVKNFLLSGDRRADRKIREVLLARRLEQALGKDAILEVYLNEIFLGQNAYGVTAAAQTYFNKPLHALAAHEAAMIAALPKAPSDLHPVRDRDRLRERRDYVLREMHENGHLTADAYATALAEPIQSVQGGDFPAHGETLPPRDYFTDEVRRRLSERFGPETFASRGFTLRATLDADMQAAAARALRRGLEAYDRAQGVFRPTGLRLAPEDLADEARWRAGLAGIDLPRDIELDVPWRLAVVLDLSSGHAQIGIEGVREVPDGHWIPTADMFWARRALPDGGLGPQVRYAEDILRTGEIVFVRAVPKRDGTLAYWSLRQIPEIQGGFMAMEVGTGRVIAMQGGFSYQHSVFNRATQALRQPGSAFKPIVYAAALESGMTPDSVVLDAPIEIATPEGPWRPQNASRTFFGEATLQIGLERSRNAMAVRLADKIGIDRVAGYADWLGIYDGMRHHMANALGAQETTLDRMVAAYATIANGGVRVDPVLVDRIADPRGRTLFELGAEACPHCDPGSRPPMRGPGPLSRGEQVLDPVNALRLTRMMRGVVERGTASSAIDLPVQVAGKTGTTNDAKDVWFVGFTSTIAAGCYMGLDTPTPMGPGAYGGTMCAPVFQEFMEQAILRYGGDRFQIATRERLLKFDRDTGARLPRYATGPDVLPRMTGPGPDTPLGLGPALASTDLPVPNARTPYIRTSAPSNRRPAFRPVTVAGTRPGRGGAETDYFRP